MPFPSPTLRERRQQVRDDVATHTRGADASIANTVLRATGDAQASLALDNDIHLDWVVRMAMPDTAEGEFCDRWADIWLPQGRKGASYATGAVTVAGTINAIVPTGERLTGLAFDLETGESVVLEFVVTEGITLSSTTGVVVIDALTPGALANLDEGAFLSFVTPPGGIDGQAVVAAPGLAGGAEIERDEDLIARYIARIQSPPHGGKRDDYEQWALEVPGVTRAWAKSEMGIGTMTVRIMLDDVRKSFDGIAQAEDLALVKAYIDAVRPVTVADFWVEAVIKQEHTITISGLSRDTPEVRNNIKLEVREMLRARAAPGGTISASWIREAVSAATGEDHHDLVVSNLVPTLPGRMIFINVVFA